MGCSQLFADVEPRDVRGWLTQCIFFDREEKVNNRCASVLVFWSTLRVVARGNYVSLPAESVKCKQAYGCGLYGL